MSNESNPNQQAGSRARVRARADSHLAAQGPRWAWPSVVIVAGALAGFGILRRIHADTVLADTHQRAGRSHGHRRRAQAGRAGRQLCAARQRDRLHRFAHLRAHRRLPDALVLRHRRAREEGRAAGRDRHSRSGPATGPGRGRPEYRPGQRQQRPHPGRALHRPRQIQRRLPPGHRHLRQPGRGHRGAVNSAQANVAAPARTAIL